MDDSTAWWRNYFSGAALDFQRGMSPAEQTGKEADFLVRALAPAPGAIIADVPCGNGRLTLALAERGFRMTGVDLTGEILDDGRRAAAERGLNVEFHQRDMRDLPWREHFDHVFCFGNSFGYFDEAGNRAFLAAVRRILRPGGRFALQSGLISESILRQPLQPRWYELGDVYLLHQTQYDPLTSRLTSSYIFVKDGQLERKQAIYQTYTYRQLETLLRDVGFTRFESFGTLDRAPFELGSPMLLIVAE